MKFIKSSTLLLSFICMVCSSKLNLHYFSLEPQAPVIVEPPKTVEGQQAPTNPSEAQVVLQNKTVEVSENTQVPPQQSNEQSNPQPEHNNETPAAPQQNANSEQPAPAHPNPSPEQAPPEVTEEKNDKEPQEKSKSPLEQIKEMEKQQITQGQTLTEKSKKFSEEIDTLKTAMMEKVTAVKAEYSTFLDSKLKEFNDISEELRNVLNGWTEANLKKDGETKAMLQKMGEFLEQFQKFIADSQSFSNSPQ